MALDKYAKLDLFIRSSFRAHLADQLSAGKQRAVVLPNFEIPRFGGVDLFLAPKGGTTLGLVLRSDFVAAYKHAVGQVVGALAHYHQMKERDTREAVRATTAHPDMEELKQGKVDVLKVSQKLQADRKEGRVTVALATDLPDVPQQARELESNFLPVAHLLEAGLTVTVSKKKLCQEIVFYAVSQGEGPDKVMPLEQALKKLVKVSAS